MTAHVLVSGDFVTTGGMDRANYALASYLARTGHEVHLVSHRVAPELLALPRVRLHRVPKFAGSYFLAGFALDRQGRRCAAGLRSQARVLVNGGNCQWGDINWVHYVHAAYDPDKRRGPRGWLTTLRHRVYRRQERAALSQARLVIANSERTRRDVIEKLGVHPDRVCVIYYGSDSKLLHPSGPAERTAARAALGWLEQTPVVAFVGALGDRRKGFDTLFAAWQELCASPSWDALLIVVGTGVEKAAWEQRMAAAGLAGRIRFLGFRADVPRILASSDVLVSPTRYEAYGLGVHEALCCGLPALVTASAGIAERYPPELHDLLLPDADDAADLARRLRNWRGAIDEWKERVRGLGELLRSRSWDDMAAEMVRAISLPQARPLGSGIP